MSRTDQTPEEQAPEPRGSAPQGTAVHDGRSNRQDGGIEDDAHHEGASEGGPSTAPVLLPDRGSTPFASGNDAVQQDIQLDTLNADGQTQRNPPSCPCPGHTHHHHHGNHQQQSEGPHEEATVEVGDSGGNSQPQDQAQRGEIVFEDGASDRFNLDIEHDAALEPIVVLVVGVHCPTCGNEILRSLQRTRGVFHPSVNIVAGRIDLQLNTSIISPEEVLTLIRRRHHVRVMLASEQDHHLDVLIPRSLVPSVADQNLPGFLDIVPLGKNSARVSYEPKMTGARTLLESLKEFSQVVELAPRNVDPAVSQGKKLRCQKLLELCAAASLTLPVAILNLGHISMNESTKAIVSLVLATLVQVIAIPEFYKPAFESLVYYHTLEMDMLVTVSITAAYVYSATAFGYLMAGSPLEEKAFFETSAMLITFVLLGRYIAHYAREYAVGKVSIRPLQPTRATIVENGQDREVDSRLLQLGDRFKVLPQTKIPTDGIVDEGEGEVDESMLTGESLPVRKVAGSSVSAGTINGTATLIVQLSRLPGRNTVTDIAGQVEEASKSKPPVQELADRLAKHVVVIVVVVAIFVFSVWLGLELKIRHSGAGKAVARAITYAVAVLAVSCPCALGLAVPMVIVVAGGLAAKAGVVVKASNSTVNSRKVTDVVFDKTGTITQPTLEVERDHTFSFSREAVFPVVKALVQNNRHPVSVAVDRFLQKWEADVAVSEIQVVPSQGVIANLDGDVIRAGNPRWNLSDSEPDIKEYLDEGFTVLSVTRDEIPIVCFAIRSQLQTDAVNVVSDLTRRGVAVHLVSGDHDVAVRAVAREAGIPAANVVSRCSLQDKVHYVSRLQSEKKHVMFCGDGANDAGAVARADVGVHMGGSLSSSDITCDAANVVLLNGLRGIPYLLDVSRSAWRRIVFNFVWALTYNTVAILMASGAFVKAGGEKARVPPQYAGLGELISVLPVVIAGATMLFSRSVGGSGIFRRLLLRLSPRRRMVQFIQSRGG